MPRSVPWNLMWVMPPEGSERKRLRAKQSAVSRMIRRGTCGFSCEKRGCAAIEGDKNEEVECDWRGRR